METLIYTALRDVAPDGEDEIILSKDDLSLIRPTERLLAGRSTEIMGEDDFNAQATATRFLVCKYQSWVRGHRRDELSKNGLERFYTGLMALQVIKPIRTFGYIYSDSKVESRPKMEPGPWALKKQYDDEMLNRATEMVGRIQRAKDENRSEHKLALIFLQLGLEHFHLLIAGLFWVMGIEAIFNTSDRDSFKKKLCTCLGEDSPAFPPWSVPGPVYSVGEIALDLYMLRNKLVHGRSFLEALNKGSNPVDLTKQVSLPDSPESAPYASVLSEAACYLLCQVLQKVL